MLTLARIGDQFGAAGSREFLQRIVGSVLSAWALLYVQVRGKIRIDDPPHDFVRPVHRLPAVREHANLGLERIKRRYHRDIRHLVSESVGI